MADASPTKWHLAHTTWFFETFVLKSFAPHFALFDAGFPYLFNSYYEAEGPRHARPRRGMLTRPGIDNIRAYRAHVDEKMRLLMEQQSGARGWPEIVSLIELGCQHEEQHQELILTDIKHAFSTNPTAPAYSDGKLASGGPTAALNWHEFDPGLVEIGCSGDGFAFDCERPRHKRYVHPFALASRLVTNSEFLEFLVNGGYQDPGHWLSDGWAWVQENHVKAPLYWRLTNDKWYEFTLAGLIKLDPATPASHLSYFEAAAYASWASARLPREEELEIACDGRTDNNRAQGGFARLHPEPAGQEDKICQLAGDLWEWTQSAYAAYPGFHAAPGAAGEYNGKFMCNQFVLRGGSCVTPVQHWRPSYRNFFPPDARWQFSGFRLARDK